MKTTNPIFSTVITVMINIIITFAIFTVLGFLFNVAAVADGELANMEATIVCFWIFIVTSVLLIASIIFIALISKYDIFEILSSYIRIFKQNMNKFYQWVEEIHNDIE